MKTLTCMIVDDEPLAVKMLEDFVSRTPYLRLAASFNDPVLALSTLRESSVDVLFLDIQMRRRLDLAYPSRYQYDQALRENSYFVQITLRDCL